jgi:multidrug efflux pump subunit AcrA (membrane-fusion protein)
MKYKLFSSLVVLLLLIPLLAACGAPAVAQQEEPTPTPLPPDPALERETFTVERGPIDRILEINGRVTPVDLVRLSFLREGRVAQVNVKRGDPVKAGDVLAELLQDEQLEALRDAEDQLASAQRDLEDQRKAQVKAIQQAQLDLEQANEDLQRLLPGGADDPIRAAQDELEEAIRASENDKATASEAKTNAEYTVVKNTEALQDQQRAYSKAWWDWDWVQRYGTHPRETVPISGTDATKPRELTEEEKEQFQVALTEAERTLREAERTLALSQRELDELRGAEINQVDNSDEKVREAQLKLDGLLTGKGNRDLIAAQRNVEAKRLALEEERTKSFNSQIKAVETAQRALDKARKQVEDGRIIAPQDGQVIVMGIGEGDTVQSFESVVEIADPTQLEIATELSGDQMRQLQEGQPAEVTLLSRPDVIMPAVIRQMPAPYGSGGSGAVQEQDRTTRFNVEDTKGQELTPGTVTKIRIVLEHKDNVLWLPPDAIRSFEGRRFVVIRRGDREQRATVKLGIETEERVEILEGVEEGDVIVGQ